ncbi:hypothetical protein [Phenylobacterium sp.]|jgi:hypothetical protein|uniref:hypothetical protein n=1 Tax=Phenylobacterium sp. TaxID=1871053 RepID=UPI000C9025D2|nr:hypothetical protein [Phenylobacterium sp.]MAK81903.1 hypothetical protein [Phenylobacterium sp.]|tara:strand:- start:10304 stop:10759 length:456 start_codon:yes stop_codon:yes gene_type:complete
MARRIVTRELLVQEVRWNFLRLALKEASLVLACAALAVAACYLPSGFPLRTQVLSACWALAFIVPPVLYLVTLTAVGGVARDSGEFTWGIWSIAALATAVWPVACLEVGLYFLGGQGVLEPQIQRALYLAAILSALQFLWWSVAAGLGRVR